MLILSNRIARGEPAVVTDPLITTGLSLVAGLLVSGSGADALHRLSRISARALDAARDIRRFRSNIRTALDLLRARDDRYAS